MWRCASRSRAVSWCAGCLPGPRWRSRRRHRGGHLPTTQLYHQVTYPIVGWYAERGILVLVDAMRPPEQVGWEILAALEVMRPLVDHVSGETRRAVDLTSLGVAFGATPPASDSSGYAPVNSLVRWPPAPEPRARSAPCPEVTPAR